MIPCPAEDEWILLVDEQVDPARAAGMRAHAASCEACRSLAEDLRGLVDALSQQPAVDVEKNVASVSSRIRSERAPMRRPWLAAAGGLAVAAGVLLALTRFAPPRDAAFQARGGGAAPRAVVRSVEVTLSRLEGTKLVPLRSGDRLGADTAFTGSYRAAEPAYAMIFAIDSAKTAHWLYPAYTDPQTDPESVHLARTASEVVLPTSVVLASPAAGPMHVYAIVTPAPHHVSEVERLAPTEIALEPLVRRMPDASIEEWTFEVAP